MLVARVWSKDGKVFAERHFEVEKLAVLWAQSLMDEYAYTRKGKKFYYYGAYRATVEALILG